MFFLTFHIGKWDVTSVYELSLEIVRYLRFCD